MENFTRTTTNRLNKILFGLLFSLIISLTGFSQNVGINSSGAQPNASAGLDVDFADKGLLIPRVSLTTTSSFAPLSAHVAGMVVYNTATAGDVSPGFYYNNGTKWVPGFLKGQSVGDMLYWSGFEWLRIPIGVPGQYLQISGSSVPTWGGTIFSTLSTTTATAITTTTATSGGVITSDGGSAVLTRGICWNAVGAPTIASSKTTDVAGGIGTFAGSMTGLLSGTTYYVRSYAINSNSISYGNEISFTTLASSPTLAATTAASAITGSTANSGGNVTATGGAAITERGVCYATTQNPTILTGTKVIDPSPGAGSFISNLTGLSGGTLYYVRAYATNSIGTSYGTQISFTTTVVPPTLVTAAATNISGASATSGATMNWNGGGYSNYQAYGVAYSTTPGSATPTKVATNTANGSVNPAVNIAPWVTNIVGLAANTTYYIRSYLDVYRSGWITIYGNELSFTTTAPTAPVVGTTTAATLITGSTVRSGGAIISDGGSAITAKGVCWGTSASPTLGADNFTVNGTGTSSFVSNPTGLSGSTTYYIRAYATNAIGTSYSAADQTFTTCVTSPYKVGDFAGGGRVFYVDCNGSGLIAALGDQPTTAVWGCSGTNIVTSNTLGTGAANTAAILAGCPLERPIAASVASSCTDGGYNDWYLPSQAELGLLINSGYVFGVQVSYYCSSSQSSATQISGYYYANNWQASGLSKTTQFKVRAIRSFSGATLATVTTTAISNIAGTTATGGGNVTNDGGAPILAAGVCWSTTTGPTIADSKTNDATTVGAFTSSLSGLTISTPYYVRAYVTNAAGTSYGSEVSFSTVGVSLPSVTTDAITNLGGTSATSGGNVTSEGGSAVSLRGVCYGLTPNPDPAVDQAIYDVTGGLGAFVSNLTGLTNGQQYYLRAFATNSDGTAFGSDVVFTPSGNSLPTITTAIVTNPTPNGGTSGGDVTSDGGDPVTARGICWSTTTGPTIADLKTSDGSGTGIFVSNISGLTSGLGYFIRAYATNSLGTAYGQEEYYMPVGPPTIAAGQLAYWAGDTFAQLVVNVTSDGGDPLLAYGAVWGTSTNPTVASHTGITTENLALGWWANALVSPLVNLTTYYIRAYATNSLGTTYGTEISLTPGVLGIPTVQTDPIINKIGSLAEGGGNILSDGGDPIITGGLCWGLSADPTVDTNLGMTTDGFSGQFYSTISGLTVGTTYHVRAYGTNSTGTAYGADLSFIATAATLGQVIQGGMNYWTVFSVDGTGNHGLIVETYPWMSSDWGCTSSVTGATGTAVGDGTTNTNAIMADITTNACTSAYAGDPNWFDFAANASKWNGADWYLPSKDEVDLFGLTLPLTGSIWSSSEIDATHAWYFDGTTWQSGLKTAAYLVWSIRSF